MASLPFNICRMGLPCIFLSGLMLTWTGRGRESEIALRPETAAVPLPEYRFRGSEKGCVNAEGVAGLNRGAYGECGDLRGVRLRDFSFRGRNLSGADFSQSELTSVDFRGSALAGACFLGALLDSP